MTDEASVTDAQIRELMRRVREDVGSHPQIADREAKRIIRLCKVALNDAPTYLRAAVVRDARKRVAQIIRARASR